MAPMREILRKVILIGLLAIPFVPLFSSSGLFFPFITTKAFLFRAIVEVVFFAWIILAVSSPEYRPKKGWILYAVLAFIAVVGLSNMFGMAPAKSFWSNFERMEGYVTILHLGALFVVMTSFFREKQWKWWWNTSLSVSALIFLYALLQISGSLQVSQGGPRIDATFGNTIYLAVYMLVHFFVALFFLVRAKTSGLRWTYSLLIVAQLFTLYNTSTRGALFGLIGGLTVMAVFNLKNSEDKRLERLSRAILIGIVLIASSIYVFRDSGFIQKSVTLSRFANLSYSSLVTEGRAFIWPMAVEGIKEKPLLGWGQENFNYVFAEHYSADMFRLEPWFDRAHNVYLDWGVSSGLLGLSVYLSMYVALLFSIWKSVRFSRADKSILIGLVSAYAFNNIFIFDNLISYILFFSVLAYVHSVSVEQTSEDRWNENNFHTALPIVLVACLLTLYFVNIKPIITNRNLLQGLQAAQLGDGAKSMESFEKAYNGSRLGRPEVVEWMSISAVPVLSDVKVPIEERNRFFSFMSESLERQVIELSGDPRYEMTAGAFYGSTGQWDKSISHLEESIRIMPEKQILYVQLARTLYLKNDLSAAHNVLKKAYELAPENEEVKKLYETNFSQL